MSDSDRLVQLQAEINALRHFTCGLFLILRVVAIWLREQRLLDQNALGSVMRDHAKDQKDPAAREMIEFVADLFDPKQRKASPPVWLKGIIPGGLAQIDDPPQPPDQSI